jgi:hypothetical protein
MLITIFVFFRCTSRQNRQETFCCNIYGSWKIWRWPKLLVLTLNGAGKQRRTTLKHFTISPLLKICAGAAMMIAAPFALAGSPQVSWSVSVGSGYPAATVYSPPPVVYVQPEPVYVQPRPVYVRPRPVYVTPQPVYVTPAPVVQHYSPYYGHGHGYGHGRKHKHRDHHWKHDRHHYGY